MSRSGRLGLTTSDSEPQWAAGFDVEILCQKQTSGPSQRNMRQPQARLVISPPSTRHAALHSLELSRVGCAPLGGRLWRLRGDIDFDADAASVGLLLLPLRRAPTFELLLRGLCDEELAGGDTPWTLHYSDHGCTRQEAARAQALCCAIARYLPGPPELLSGSSHSTRRMWLVRSRRLWYLADTAARPHAEFEAGMTLTWTVRPYTFSAATDLALARIVLSLAMQAHASVQAQASGSQASPAQLPTLLDPCCGSGTNLLAASLRGVSAVGLDINPLAVAGARANLDHIATELAWPEAACPAIYQHDVSAEAALPLPHASTIGLVVANLPWGREERLRDAFQLRDMLRSVVRSVPAETTYALLSATPIRATLAEAGLRVLDEAPVGSRCVLSIARRRAEGRPPAEESPAAASERLNAADAAANDGPLELLSGGGLRGETALAAPTTLAAGDAIALQVRAPSGRLWMRARVVSIASPSQSNAPPADEEDDAPAMRDREWCCTLTWKEPRVEARLPKVVKLKRHGGPNWRFASTS